MQKGLFYEAKIYQNPEDKSELSSLAIRRINEGISIKITQEIDSRFPYSAEYFFSLRLCKHIKKMIEDSIWILETNGNPEFVGYRSIVENNIQYHPDHPYLKFKDYFTGENGNIGIQIVDMTFNFIRITFWPTEFQSETEIAFDTEEGAKIVQALNEALG